MKFVLSYPMSSHVLTTRSTVVRRLVLIVAFAFSILSIFFLKTVIQGFVSALILT